MIVVDACVAVKWFIPEPGASAATALFRSGEILCAPAHVTVEVGPALLRHQRDGVIDYDQAVAALGSLTDLLSLVAAESLAVEAYSLAARFGVTIYDALYVVLAGRIGGVLVTADSRLFARISPTPLSRAVRLLDQ